MTEETGLSVLDFQAPRTATGPHACSLSETTGLCVRCGGGLLHKIHRAAAEAAYCQRRQSSQTAPNPRHDPPEDKTGQDRQGIRIHAPKRKGRKKS